MAQAKAKSASAPKKPSLAHGVGRRKSSVARAWFHRGSGKVFVGGKPVREYFDTPTDVALATTPMRIVPMSANYDLKITVRGGGKVSQADAVKLAISRGLVLLDASLRPLLRKHKLLTVDSRLKERKKPGQKGARRKFQFVKR